MLLMPDEFTDQEWFLVNQNGGGCERVVTHTHSAATAEWCGDPPQEARLALLVSFAGALTGRQ